jgi:hypothetical protein
MVDLAVPLWRRRPPWRGVRIACVSGEKNVLVRMSVRELEMAMAKEEDGCVRGRGR